MKKAWLILLPAMICAAPTPQKEIEAISKKYLGDPYVWGGTDPRTGMDCSGYTKYVYKKVGITIPRTAYEQSKIGHEVSLQDLKKGDLLFFLTDKKRGIPITHVGIYLDHGKFIHAASTKKGIIISNLKGYYKKAFRLAKRVITSSPATSESFFMVIDDEAKRSSMDIKLTSFGGVHDHDTF